jgi:hypothetical protein
MKRCGLSVSPTPPVNKCEMIRTEWLKPDRLNDREHLKQAEAIFAEIGAEFDLQETRSHLALVDGFDSD